jgi:hypothetical protein
VPFQPPFYDNKRSLEWTSCPTLSYTYIFYYLPLTKGIVVYIFRAKFISIRAYILKMSVRPPCLTQSAHSKPLYNPNNVAEENGCK